MTNSLTITDTNLQDVLTEIDAAFYDIPFENSEFQNKNFVIASQVTPERAYRAIGLRLSSKIRALKEAQFSIELENIDIAELEEKIADPNTNKWDRKRFQIEIDKKLSNRPFTKKLVNDAIAEVNTLYAQFKTYPTYTREQFEAGEQVHFETKLVRQIQGIVGAHESLANMQADLPILSQKIAEQVLALTSNAK